MKFSKFTSLLVSVFISLITVTTFASKNSSTFTDVPDNHWAKDQIEAFANQGIIDGYNDGKFKPDDGVTREEFCKLLVSTFNAQLETPDSPSFSDVSQSRWSYAYIELCKDFLTGYANPFGGMPAFHPEEYATREDIAVALVRMLGFTEDDARNDNYARQQFSDGNEISPNLMTYVSIACEKGLVNGYNNGKFEPQKGITRAETIVLLNRATKQAVTNITAELELSASLSYNKDRKSVTITITSEPGATVTVNDINVKMTTDYSNKSNGTYTYKFPYEGVKYFTVTASKAGKTKSVSLSAEYKEFAPTLQITNCPKTADNAQVTIEGIAKSQSSNSLTVTVNGSEVSVDYNGAWSKTLKLANGINEIEIIAKDEYGVKTVEKRTIEFDAAPLLQITNCPKKSDSSQVTIEGTVKSKTNSNITLTVEGSEVSVGYSGSWRKTLNLVNGTNEIKIVAKDENGSKTTIKKFIDFNATPPSISFSSIPTTVVKKTVTIDGYVNDEYGTPTFTVNDTPIELNYSNRWSITLDLQEGNNTFVFVAKSKTGATATVTKNILLNENAPEIKLNTIDAETIYDSYEISGTIENVSGSGYMLKVNGESVPHSSYRWSHSINLKPGVNTITIEAFNDLGKSTSLSKSITFAPPAPILKITNWPINTNKSKALIEGEISDTNDTAPTVTVNGDSVKIYKNYNKNEWEATVDLQIGSNSIEVEAVNKYGKVTRKTIVVNYNVAPPSLSVTNWPTTTEDSTVLINGKVSDAIDSDPVVSVNGVKATVSSDGSWKAEINVAPGKNSVKVEACNSYGLTTTKTVTVEYINDVEPNEDVEASTDEIL